MRTKMINTETWVEYLMTDEENRAKKDFERHLREERREEEQLLKENKLWSAEPITFANILATALSEPSPDFDFDIEDDSTGC